MFTGNSASMQGGALYCAGNANPVLTECLFQGNISQQGNGGAISVRDARPVFSDNEFIDNSALLSGGAIYVRNSANAILGPGNVFTGNQACGGNDLAASSVSTQPISASDNIFAGFAGAEAWVHPLNAFDITGHTSSLTPVMQDVYVSADGDDEANSGLSPADPFRTIRHALNQLQTGLPTPLVIHLAAGNYSTINTGETFPLPLLSGIVILGAGPVETTIDSTGATGCFRIEFAYDTGLHDALLTGTRGPGVFARESTGALSGLDIIGFGNTANGAGAQLTSGASLHFSDCLFQSNHATVSGGAIHLGTTAAGFTQCQFNLNSAVFSGGAVFNQSGSTPFDACEFIDNTAAQGGAVHVAGGSPVLAAGTIGPNAFSGNMGARGANLSAPSVFTTPVPASGCIFDLSPECAASVSPADSFDASGFILTSPPPMHGATVYVATDGDDTNDGLTLDTPFRTLTHALHRVTGSDDAPAVVIVAEGTWSDANNESFPLPVPSHVTITGAGLNATFLESSDNTVMDFFFSNGARLEHLSITSSNGPAVTIEQCSPDLYSIAIRDCRASVNGSGMSIINGSPHVDTCLFEQNFTTRMGGAVHCSISAAPIFTDCLFYSNSALQMGGALLCGYYASACISGCIFDDNSADRHGGAVAAHFGSVSIGNSIFRWNRALKSGGAVYVSDATSDLSAGPNTFEHNIATIGADLAAVEALAEPVDVGNSVFNGIPLSEYYIAPAGSFDVSECSGAIAIQQDIYIAPWGDDMNSGITPNSPFRSIRYGLSRVVSAPDTPVLTVNLAAGTYDLSDEAWPGTLLLLSHITIAGEAADTTLIDAGSIGSAGGAWLGFWNQQSALRHLTVCNSRASAIDLTFCTVTIDQCHFHSNVTSGNGAAVTSSGGLLILRNSLFSGNHASGYGGGVDVRQFGALLMTECDFEANQAGSQGGGISTWFAAGRADNCRFTANRSALGGGWNSRLDRGMIVTGSVFSANEAESGGGVAVFQGHFGMIDTLIAENIASPLSEVSGYGGGVVFDACSGTMTNCTIAGNIASGFSRVAGGGVAVTGGANVSIRDSIIWSNAAPVGADLALLWRWNASAATVNWSVAGNDTGESVHISPESILHLGSGVLQTDPLFVPERTQFPIFPSRRTASYSLSSIRSGQTITSPCVDAGSEPAWNASYLAPDGVRYFRHRTTESGGWPDTGMLDMGSHRPVPDCIHSGDVDGDGEITWTDVELIFFMALGEKPDDYRVFCAADVNGDGEVTATDAREAFSMHNGH